MPTPDTLLMTNGLAPVSADNILVTPTGGTQATLAAALAEAGGSGGPVDATTLSASSTVTLSPANANVTVAPTGTGEVIINPATAGTMDNMVIGGTTPAAATVTTLSSATNAAIVLTSQTSGAGSGAGTLTNAPSAGNPGFWLALKINGTTYHVPAW